MRIDPPRGFDLLRLPGLRRFLRWRYARLVFQLPLLLLAVMAIADGLTGPPAAARNLATASVWLHYRGLVVIALALFGNAFCAACPLMLTRGLTRRLERWLPAKLAWPAALRSKAVVIVLTVLFLWSYEVFGLWASPWLTAWLAVGYFLAALAVDALFPAGTFCRYVCPLGNFNFALSSVSPTQIAAVDATLCESCAGKPCLYGRVTAAAPAGPTTPPTPPSTAPETNAPVAAAAPGSSGAWALTPVPYEAVVHPNGSGTFPGCESRLFVPALASNLDCTLCMNCVRACPYDNVALRLRAPGRELSTNGWARRGGLAALLLGVLLAFWAVLNAVAMIGPFHAVAAWLAGVLGSRNEALLIGVLYALVTLAGLVLTGAAALAADALGGAAPRVGRAFRRWGYVVVALGFGFWAAHYLFHFVTGLPAAVPVFASFLRSLGLPLTPVWPVAHMMALPWLFPLQALVTASYALLALITALRIGLRDFGRGGVVAMWPMVVLVLAFTALQILVWAQPMQMRGTLMGPAG